MDYEDGAVKTLVEQIEGENRDIEHFLWKNAGNIQNLDISVLKIRDKFWFFDNNAEIVSASPLNQSNSLTVVGFDPTGGNDPITYDYTFINGSMIIASGHQYITILSYDNITDVVSSEISYISIRDTFGIYDSRPVDERPEFLTDPPYKTFSPIFGGRIIDAVFDSTTEAAAGIHIYNLLNQGWRDDYRIYPSGSIGDTIEQAFDSLKGKLPSNADTFGLYQTSNMFDTTLLRNPLQGTVNSPKGSIIFDNMFIRGAIRKEKVEGRSGRVIGSVFYFIGPVGKSSLFDDAAIEATGGGISRIKSFSGRLFFAINENGVSGRDKESPSLGSMLFFSKATDGLKKITECHTEIDPTDFENFAFLDTDGGFITVSGIGNILDMEVLGSSLFLIADNGIWQINGGGSTLTSSNINVIKVSNIGTINRKGATIAGDSLFYLSDAGLVQVTLNENDISLPATVTDISQNTIQSFLNGLSFLSKQNSIASYDKYSNSIKWLFSSGAPPDEAYFDIELILDLNLSAFYPNKIKTIDNVTGEGSPYIVAYLERPSAILVDTTKTVVVSGDTVVVSGDTVGITFRTIDNTTLSSNKYWAISKADSTHLNFSVAEYRDLQFREWGSIQNTVGSFGTDANAFLLTGYLTGGDSSTNKRVTYITSHFRRTERILSFVDDGFEADNPSSCTLTAQWEWTSSANTGRWSRPQEIYRLPRTFIPDVGTFDYGFEVVTTKNKLRGKGKALSLLFQTSPLKDCHLYGWSYEINSEQSV